MINKATREQTKRHNRNFVLRTIYHAGSISQAAVSRQTHLTRATISEIVAELAAEGLLAEVGVGQSTGGKPPTLLSVVDDARCMIGIDLASNEFRGAVVNLRGQVLFSAVLPVHDCSGDMALALVYKLVDKLVAVAQSPILGIGIGAPGLMNAGEGVVRYAVNLEWRDLPLGSLLRERYHMPALLLNDSQAAALAEFNFGAEKYNGNIFLLKLGRGIGSGIVLNSQVYCGDGSGAGEIGHVRVVEDGLPCRCGNTGCLETVASSRALLCQAREAAAVAPDSALALLAQAEGSMTLTVLARAFFENDPAAKQIISQAAMYIGHALSYVVSILNVGCVVIAGYAALFGEDFLKFLRQELSLTAFSVLAEQTRVVFSTLGPDIVVSGAAAAILQKEMELL